jgi:cobalt/nickel transport system ATP-binding protein
LIRLQDVGFAYPDGNQALDQICLNIDKGSTVAIVGANGAGKSTLLSLLVGIQMPKEGTITINDLVLNKSNLDKIRRMVGFVFQNPDDQLFMSRVSEDIAFGPRNYGCSADETERRVKETAELLQIEHLLDRAPYKLSGGEKRSAAVAATLAVKPEVVLLDEPSSFLDPRGRRNLIRLLGELSLTKVIATHDLDLVLDLCARVVILKKGSVFADGSPYKLFRNEELMEECGLEVPLSLQRQLDAKNPQT